MFKQPASLPAFLPLHFILPLLLLCFLSSDHPVSSTSLWNIWNLTALGLCVVVVGKKMWKEWVWVRPESRLCPLGYRKDGKWGLPSWAPTALPHHLAGRVGPFCAQLRPPRPLAVNGLFSGGVRLSPPGWLLQTAANWTDVRNRRSG